MKKLFCVFAALFSCAVLNAAVNDFSRDEFQFTFGFSNPLTSGSKKSWPKSTVYLYIPVAATKVRALLLLEQNVIEQRISVDPAIRRVCDAQGVAIAWCSPGFDLIFTKDADRLHALIQDQFRQFGRTIGYPELGDVPLIAFGHSNTTAYVQNGAEAKPDRVLAAVVTHGWNGVNSLNRYKGPVFVFIGSYWEFKQQAAAIDANKGVASLAEVQKRLKRGWMPISIAEEYGSGHFDYDEQMVGLFAMFIDKAINERLAADGTLKDIDPTSGYIALIPEFPSGPITIKPYTEASSEEHMSGLWYFDREMAEATVKVIEGNGPWSRGAQLIGFKRADGTTAPYSKSGLVDPVPYEIVPGTNEIHIFPQLLGAFPEGFLKAGQSIGRCSDPSITLEYDCGPYLYRDENGAYRVKLNRNGFSGYIVARNLGDAQLRPAVQPTRLLLGERPRASAMGESEDGAALRWQVDPAPIDNPGDQLCGAHIVLKKSGVAGEFLGYYVDHGPARVVGDELQILALPANTPGPLEVQLTAYRLGQIIKGVSSVTFHVAPKTVSSTATHEAFP